MSSFDPRSARKWADLDRILSKEDRAFKFKLVTDILKVPEGERSEEHMRILDKYPDIICELAERSKKNEKQKSKAVEVEDDADVLESKCRQLAEAISQSVHLIVYTGAGISTAASIPDYRGPNGVWTLLEKGQEVRPQDLSSAEPTVTHMCLAKLCAEGTVKYVVSQNCDGLHVRSGLDRRKLSEVHGNMYIEMCHSCVPPREYYRLFDVTERTGVRRHTTGRLCHRCRGDLKDTIVHFGEKGRLDAPHNWPEATSAAESCDVILCLGSSLKVIKKYRHLWCMDRPKKDRPRLFIVNLQWTPKDGVAELKINGKCDDVMERVFSHLGLEVPKYDRSRDPIFDVATKLRASELSTTTKHVLSSSPPAASGSATDLHLPSRGSRDSSQGAPTLGMPHKRECDALPSAVDSQGDCKAADAADTTAALPSGHTQACAADGAAAASTPGWYGKGFRRTKQRKRRKLS